MAISGAFLLGMNLGLILMGMLASARQE